MDEWVDMLLREERVCDIILPRLSKREVCQVRDGLAPRISKLETCLITTLEGNRVAEEEGQESDDSLSDLKRWKLQKLQQATRRTQIKTSPSPPSRQDFGLEEYTSQEESDQEMAERKRRRLISPSFSVSPDRQLSPSIALEEGEEERGYVSRSPSRSPDRT